MKILFRMAAIAAVALIAGFTVNQLHPSGIHRSMLTAAFSGGYRWRRITADSARVLLSKKAAVFVDIRSEAEFKAGHVPGAVSEPLHPFFRNFKGFEKAHPKTGTFVFYCFEPACREGQLMLSWMGRRDFRNAVWMYGGMSEWIQSGYPVEGGD
jgi:rhodanese-related sulfurtransferase